MKSIVDRLGVLQVFNLLTRSFAITGLAAVGACAFGPTVIAKADESKTEWSIPTVPVVSLPASGPSYFVQFMRNGDHFNTSVRLNTEELSELMKALKVSRMEDLKGKTVVGRNEDAEPYFSRPIEVRDALEMLRLDDKSDGRYVPPRKQDVLLKAATELASFRCPAFREFDRLSRNQALESVIEGTKTFDAKTRDQFREMLHTAAVNQGSADVYLDVDSLGCFIVRSEKQRMPVCFDGTFFDHNFAMECSPPGDWKEAGSFEFRVKVGADPGK